MITKALPISVVLHITSVQIFLSPDAHMLDPLRLSKLTTHTAPPQHWLGMVCHA